MKRKRRKIVFICVTAILLTVGSFCYLKKGIPDQLKVASLQDAERIELPFNSIVKDEVIYTVAVSGNTKIPKEEIKIKCSFLGIVPIKTVQVEEKVLPKVTIGGNTIGIFMKTKGVLVVGTGSVTDLEDEVQEPALGKMQSGDIITKIEDRTIFNKEELIEAVEECEGKELKITILRQENEKEVSLQPIKQQDGSYKIGVWVRDDTQGLGTMTYVKENGEYAALGHGISDVDTGYLMQIQEGKLYRAEVQSVKKGEKGNPGELSGTIYYAQDQMLGTITENTEIGIKGILQEIPEELKDSKQMEAAYRQEVKEGAVTIVCTVDGKIKEYSAEIEKINLSHRDINKSMVLHVTDAELLEKTGGIVQGMSGSPIIQDGKLIGAVTHVLVNDPTRGYGIFIENMLEH